MNKTLQFIARLEAALERRHGQEIDDRVDVRCEACGDLIHRYHDGGQGTPVCDVYSLRPGASQLLGTRPVDAELYRLDYVRPLTRKEIVEIQRIGRRHGL